MTDMEKACTTLLVVVLQKLEAADKEHKNEVDRLHRESGSLRDELAIQRKNVEELSARLRAATVMRPGRTAKTQAVPRRLRKI